MPRFAKGSKEAKEYMASIRKGRGKTKSCDCCGKCTCVCGGAIPSENSAFSKPKSRKPTRAEMLGVSFQHTGRSAPPAPRMMPVAMPRQDLDTTDRVLDGVREALRARLAQGTPLARATQGALKDAKRSAQLGAIDIRDYGMTTPAEGFSMYPNPPSRMPLSQEPAEMSGGGMCGGIADCQACRGMGVIAIKKHLKR